MLELRPATLEDAEMIATIHILARREAMPYLPELHSEDDTLAWVSGTVLPRQVAWVAERGDHVVGYLAMTGAELNDLYFAPGAQGHGAGSALLTKATELSAGELWLYTFQRNEEARGFYERRGFVAVEFGDGTGNEEGEPDARYHWVADES